MAGFGNALNLAFPISTALGGSGVASPTAHGILIAEGASAFNPIVLSAGQVLIGTTSGDPSAATLTNGTGINITSASGSITITNTAAAGGLATVNQTGASVTAAINTQYVNTGTANSQVTYTFPTSAALGSVIRILGVASNTGGWVAQMPASTVAYVGSAACASAGTWTSGNASDTVTFVCTVANTQWTAVDCMSQDLAFT